jgi:serine-type D-Ala-D-Ala carboxypeptidase (penicillin-binding protein 5/6)
MLGDPDGVSRLTELMQFEPDPETPTGPPPIDPAIRRRRRRRDLTVGLIVASVILASAGGYTAYALTAPIGSATLEAQAPDVDIPPAAQISLPVDGTYAISISGADDYLGAEASGIWASSGDDSPRPMASISKLISALVILNAKPLADTTDAGPTITFSRADHALYDKYYVLDATIAEMPTGSSMSERDALETMLIVSASNYAEAVSTWAYGSQSAFLRATKDWLAANGLTGTTMVEPTGIDPRNTSTPTDLIALGKIAMANPVIAEIVRMKTLEVPNIPFRASTNELIGVNGVTGIKTGTLEATGSNLLFSATLDVGAEQPLGVIGVILGGYTDDSVNLDVKALLTSIQAGFHPVVLGERGQQIGTYSTAWGESADIELGDNASVLTWSDTPVTVEFETDQLTTGSDGDVVGSVTWTVGAATETVPLVLDGTIEPPTAWWRLTHPFELGE